MNRKTLVFIGVGAVLLYFILKPKKAAALPRSEVESIPALPPPPQEPMPAAPPAMAPPAPPAPAPEPEFDLPPPPSLDNIDPATGISISGPWGPIKLLTNAYTTYAVKAGESWSNIVSRAYGDYRWWPAVWDLNIIKLSLAGKQGLIKDPDVLKPGTKIQLPVLASAVFQNLSYRDAIFARSLAHREWWLLKKTPGTRPRPYPKNVLATTDLSKYFKA